MKEVDLSLRPELVVKTTTKLGLFRYIIKNRNQRTGKSTPIILYEINPSLPDYSNLL